MLSTVTERHASAGPELVASVYWANNLPTAGCAGTTVRCARSSESGHRLFVEMSPHPILTTPVDEILQAAQQEGAAVGSLRRGRDERPAMLEALGALWVQGYPVAWERLFPASGQRVPLPTYAWQRTRHWIRAHQLEAPAPLEAPREDDARTTASAPTIRDQLREAPPSERAALLLWHLRQLVARALVIADASALDPAQSLILLGLDSLVGHQIYRDVIKSLGITKKISVGRLFAKPTVEAFARFCWTGAGARAGADGEPGVASGERSRSLSAGGRGPHVAQCVRGPAHPERQWRPSSLRAADAGRRGPALLLLHGAGANHRTSATLAEHLGDRDILVPSLPGRCELGDGSPPTRWRMQRVGLRSPRRAGPPRRWWPLGIRLGGDVALQCVMQASLPVRATCPPRSCPDLDRPPRAGGPTVQGCTHEARGGRLDGRRPLSPAAFH